MVCVRGLVLVLDARRSTRPLFRQWLAAVASALIDERRLVERRRGRAS